MKDHIDSQTTTRGRTRCRARIRASRRHLTHMTDPDRAQTISARTKRFSGGFRKQVESTITARELYRILRAGRNQLAPAAPIVPPVERLFAPQSIAPGTSLTVRCQASGLFRKRYFALTSIRSLWTIETPPRASGCEKTQCTLMYVKLPFLIIHTEMITESRRSEQCGGRTTGLRSTGSLFNSHCINACIVR